MQCIPDLRSPYSVNSGKFSYLSCYLNNTLPNIPPPTTKHTLNFDLPKSFISASAKVPDPFKSSVGHQDQPTMSSLISAVQDLISSILNVFRSILATIFSLFESVTAVFTSLVSSVVDLASGLVGFILGMFLPPERFRFIAISKLALVGSEGTHDLSGERACEYT